jgi:hypothetical protein
MHLQKLLEVERHPARLAFPLSEVVVTDHVLRELVLGVEAVGETLEAISMGFESTYSLLQMLHSNILLGSGSSCVVMCFTSV